MEKHFDTDKSWTELSPDERTRFIKEETSEFIYSRIDLRILWDRFRDRFRATEQTNVRNSSSFVMTLIAILLVSCGNALGQHPRTLHSKALLCTDGVILWYNLDLHNGEIINYAADPQNDRCEEISRTTIANFERFDKEGIVSSFFYQRQEIQKRRLLSLPFLTSRRGEFKDYRVTSWFPFKDTYKEYAYVFRWDDETKTYTSTRDLIKEGNYTRGWFNTFLVIYIIVGLFLFWRLRGMHQDAGFFHVLYHSMALFVLLGLYLQPINGFLSTAATTLVIMTIIILASSLIISLFQDAYAYDGTRG